MPCIEARCARRLWVAAALCLLSACAGNGPRVPTAAPQTASAWDDYKIQAARRLVAANPDITYMGKPPEPLLGIPVIEIELDADGSVRDTHVLREPREAKQLTAVALRAIRRAAPYGDVSHLPRPWKFVEVFLFDDEGRFKPATLDR